MAPGVTDKIVASAAKRLTRTFNRADSAMRTISNSVPDIFRGRASVPIPKPIAKNGEVLFHELVLDDTGALNQTAWYMDTREQLKAQGIITRIIVNFPLRATNQKYDHPGGDAYLAALFSATESFVSSEHPGDKIKIYRRGPNFEIDIPRSVNAEAFMASLYSSLNGLRIDFLFSKEEGGKKFKGHSIVYPNIGAWRFDPAEHSASVGELRISSSICSSRLNRQDGSKRNLFTIDTYNEDLVKNYSAETRSPGEGVGNSRRIIDAPEWKPYLDILKAKIRQELRWGGVRRASEELVNRIIRTKYVEPDSGLLNIHAFDLIGPALGKSSVGFFDGNKIGAFVRSFGFLGDSMVDVIISRRMSFVSADVLAKRGIMLFRTGPGSEEFWVLGNVSKEEMSDALEEFTEQVNRPLPFNMKASELKKAKEGRDYLANHFGPDIEDDDLLTIDLCKITRQERFSKITFTGAVWEMNPQAAEDARRHFYFYKKRAESAGERAKDVNFGRVGFIMTIDPDGRFSHPEPEKDSLVEAAQAIAFLHSFKLFSKTLGPLYLFVLEQADLK